MYSYFNECLPRNQVVEQYAEALQETALAYASLKKKHKDLVGIVTTVDWDYPQFHLTMHCYWCHVESGSLTLKEHEAARWLSQGRIRSLR